jgi:hypothetical protein
MFLPCRGAITAAVPGEYPTGVQIGGAQALAANATLAPAAAPSLAPAAVPVLAPVAEPAAANVSAPAADANATAAVVPPPLYLSPRVGSQQIPTVTTAPANEPTAAVTQNATAAATAPIAASAPAANTTAPVPGGLHPCQSGEVFTTCNAHSLEQY